MKHCLLAFALLFATGCAHNLNMRGFEHGGSMVGELHGKRIAIVVDPNRLKNSYTTSSDVHTFTFSGISEGIVEALKMRIGQEAALVEVLSNNNIPKDKAFDYFLYPEFTVRSINDFWTLGCLTTFKLVAKSKDQKQVASESAEAKRNFMFTSTAESSCKAAMTEVFNLVSDKVLGAL